MKDKFLRTVKKYGMFSPGDRVAAGISGGADSMCMLSLLNENAAELGISVIAVHVNHGIRGDEANRDELFVRNYCLTNGIEFIAVHVNVPDIASRTGESTELCARRERYRIFGEINADKIATAHTGSDRVETMLMNFSRGSGLHGLTSIPAVRDNIVRPLIDFTRTETECYCTEHGIDYVTDSTNLCDDYTRNKFRHNVIPRFTEINRAFEVNALRCMNLLRLDDEYLDSVAEEKYHECIIEKNKSLSVERLKTFGECIGKRVLIKYLAGQTSSDFELKHIDLLYDNMHGAYSLTLPSGIVISSDGTSIFCKKTIFEPFVTKTLCVDITSNISATFGKYKIFFKISDTIENGDGLLCVDRSKTDDILTVRARKPGDAISLPKRRCTKTLKKFFNETGIPIEERDMLPVLCDSRGIVAVAGYVADASRLPDKNTKKYVIIKTDGDKND